jgi:hypothetical protein
VFYGNSADDKGGGAFCWQGSFVEDCLFYRNTANLGGGYGCRNGGTLRNATIADNRAWSYGGGLWSRDGGSSLNTIIFGNTAPGGEQTYGVGTAHAFSHCCSASSLPGTQNIAADPLFADPADGDYRLTAGSPCVDAGAVWPGLDRDVEGTPRPLDGDTNGVADVDIGAYEFAHPGADTDGDGMSDSAEKTAGTSPVDETDYLRIAGMPAGAPFSFFWDTVEDRVYTVLTTTNLLSPWTNVTDTAYVRTPGTGLPATYTNGTYTDSARFFRIGVTEP